MVKILKKGMILSFSLLLLVSSIPVYAEEVYDDVAVEESVSETDLQVYTDIESEIDDQYDTAYGESYESESETVIETVTESALKSETEIETESPVELMEAITAGTNYINIPEGKIAYYTFVPESTGLYSIFSVGSDGTEGYLYESEISSSHLLKHNDNDFYDPCECDEDNVNENFSFTSILNAGTVYYIGVKFDNCHTSGIAEVKIRLDKLVCDGYYYKENGDGTVSCLGICNTEITDVVIPETISGMDVTAIGDNAFQNNMQIQSISIPDTVAEIGELAFFRCFGLKNIVLPPNVSIIRASAFADCYSLNSVQIQGQLTDLGDGAFCRCEKLENIIIPDSTTHIGERVFYDCKLLCTLTIPNLGSGGTLVSLFNASAKRIPDSLETVILTNMDRIPTSAFENCTSLKKVVMPANVERIGTNAFAGCTGLTSIEIPESVAFISKSVFKGCTKLKDIVFVGDAPKFDSTSFAGVQATVYYRGDNATWTTSKCKNYSGSMQYIATGVLTAPKISSVKNTNSGITLKWNHVLGASGYEIYRQTTGNDTFSLVGTINDSYVLTYEDTSTENEQTYIYKIKAVNGEQKSSFSEVSDQILCIQRPEITKTANTTTGIKVFWNEIPNVTGYYIYVSINGGDYKKITATLDAKTQYYVDKNVSNGNTYRYKVQAYRMVNGKKILSAYAKPVSALRLTKPKITGLKKSGYELTVSWTKKSNCSGYEIWYSTESDFSTKTCVKVSSPSDCMRSIYGLRASTYYVKVRAIGYINNEKQNGVWSSVASITK